jgi:hypothetical protein
MKVRSVAILLASVLSLSGATAVAADNPSVGSAALSTGKAGARHVALTITLRTDLQCGRLVGTVPLVLTLPPKEHVPKTIAADAVLIGGKAAGRVSVAGHVVTIAPAPPRGMLCDSIRVGTAKIAILPAAGLGNPQATGTYLARITHGGEGWFLRLPIT